MSKQDLQEKMFDLIAERAQIADSQRRSELTILIHRIQDMLAKM
jgi:hypothetical protein